MTAVDPSSVNVPRSAIEALREVLDKDETLLEVHPVVVAARALVDAAERPGAAIIEAQDAAVADTFAAPVGEPLCRCGHTGAWHPSGYCRRGNGDKACSCEQFTPSPPPIQAAEPLCGCGLLKDDPSCPCTAFTPVPVSDEAEAAMLDALRVWQDTWKYSPDCPAPTAAFLAGFRAARGEEA